MTERLTGERTMLVTGGVRSGKSHYAERWITAVAGGGPVVYAAPGPAADPETDPEWAARVRAHQSRRPAGWRTVEGVDLAGVLADGTEPVLIDCLGTWVAAVVDELDGWEAAAPAWRDRFDARVDQVVGAWQASPRRIVAVSNEVGWGVVPAYPSGRLFADLLGEVNRRIAAISDRVVLMVAGRPLLVPPDPGLD
jgi:adenosylcobinamide kinase/adenosylcobinamide-phosphate guanylyltransferase